jgi:hypothetical protein
MTRLPTNIDPTRIRVQRDPERLRDYFLRLGREATVEPDGAVQIRLATNDDESAAQYLASWSSINKIATQIESPEDHGAPPPLLQRPPRRPRLGEVLLTRGLITEPQLNEALAQAATQGDLLGRILLRNRWLFEDELARALAEQLNIPYISLRSVGVDRQLARMLPPDIGVHYATIPVGFLGDRLRVAFADPCDDDASAAISRHFTSYDPVVAELSEIESVWRSLTTAAAGH